MWDYGTFPSKSCLIRYHRRLGTNDKILQTGTGVFYATDGSTITLSPSSGSSTSTRRTTTIEIYVSYCPEPSLTGGLDQLASNFSSSGAGSYRGANAHSFNVSDVEGASLSSPSSNLTLDSNNNNSSSHNGPCITCRESVGICCPPTVQCEEPSSKCPQMALELSSNTINGYLIAQVMNSTAPVAGRRKVRALPKWKSTGKELDVKRVDSGKKRNMHKKKF